MGDVESFSSQHVPTLLKKNRHLQFVLPLEQAVIIIANPQIIANNHKCGTIHYNHSAILSEMFFDCVMRYLMGLL